MAYSLNSSSVRPTLGVLVKQEESKMKNILVLLALFLIFAMPIGYALAGPAGTGG